MSKGLLFIRKFSFKPIICIAFLLMYFLTLSFIVYEFILAAIISHNCQVVWSNDPVLKRKGFSGVYIWRSFFLSSSFKFFSLPFLFKRRYSDVKLLDFLLGFHPPLSKQVKNENH